VHYNASHYSTQLCRSVRMSQDVRRLVGGNVKRLRTQAGLSQAELASQMGVDRSYVSGLEAGERNATIITLWHIAQALSVKIGAFFDELPRNRR